MDLGRLLTPRVCFQPCFSAGLFQKFLSAEFVFDGDLRKQQSAPRPLGNQQAMLSDFYVLRKDWLGSGQQRDFNLERLQFVASDRREARVLEGRAGRTAGDGLSQRLCGLDDTYTAAQATARVQANKYSVPFCKYASPGNNSERLHERNGLFNRTPRQFEQGPAIGFRMGRHPLTSCDSPACAASAAV